MKVNNIPMLRQGQQGAVLVISLLILLIITVVGVTSMQAATMEERLSGNMQEQNVAFQSGEAGLREVEQSLLANAPHVLGTKVTSLRVFNNNIPGLHHVLTNPGLDVDVQGGIKATEIDFEKGNAKEATSVTGSGDGASLVVTYLGRTNGHTGGELDNTGGGAKGSEMDLIRLTASSEGLRENTRVVVESTVGVALIPEN